MDPCVEDQFRLVVYYSNHRNSKKNGGILQTNERNIERNTVIQVIGLQKLGMNLHNRDAV